MARFDRPFPVFLLLVAACSGDPVAEVSRARARTPAPAAAAKPKPPAVDLSLSLGAGFEMHRPVRDGRLSVIPIVAIADPPQVHYMTLSQGVAQHKVTIREMPTWQIDRVRIRNRGVMPVFAMAGELIIDARQDRVLAESAVIPPGQTFDIHVRCVEQGREEGGKTFHPAALLAGLDMRRTIAHDTQAAVWILIDTINKQLDLRPPGRSYRQAAQLQGSGESGARRDRIAAQLAADPDRDRIVGFAVAVDGDVLAIDRFATPELEREFELALLGSYSSGLDRSPPHEGRTLLPADVRVLATTPGADVTEAALIALQPPS